MLTKPRNVLIPVDTSRFSRDALRYAINHFLRSGDIVHLLHVLPFDVQFPISSIDVDAGVCYMNDESRKEVETEYLKVAQEVLDSFADFLVNSNVEVKKVVKVGDAAEIITDLSKDMDTIIMGCRGLGTVKRVLLGSVSSHCVHHSHCPVIVVREPKVDLPEADADSILNAPPM